jgi:hypothetical protein
MKQIIYIFCLVLLAGSCRSSKDYLERSDADKALQDAVKKLNKNATDENATAALPVLYKSIRERHLAKITSLEGSKEIARWDKIISEYESLQQAYDAIINSPAAFKLVTPQSFSSNLFEMKHAAATEYYDQAEQLLLKSGRENSRKAYSYYKKADKYVPGFKDSKEKMEQAYENAIVNVIINPLTDNSFFFNSGWGNNGYNYSNEYFQQRLVRELEVNNNRYAARFFTEWEARRENIQPDWVVDLNLRNMDIPYPVTNNYSRNASARVQVGTDTSGKPVYNTVYATLNISRMSFTAYADLELSIKDVKTRKNIRYRTFREDYRWEQDRATYHGDSRALSAADWQIINNNYNTPRKEEVLNELYRKLYPSVLNNIRNAADW